MSPPRWPGCASATRRCRFAYVGHSFGGQALGLLPNNSEISRALFIAAQAGYWKLMASPERYRVYAMLNFVGLPLTRSLGYLPGKAGLGMDLPKDVFLQWVGWVMSPRYLFDDAKLEALQNFPKLQGRVARALHVRRSLGDAAGGRIAVLGIYRDQARDHHRDAGGCRRQQDRPFRIFQARASRHAVARGGGMDRGGGVAAVVPANASGPIATGFLQRLASAPARMAGYFGTAEAA